MYALHTRVQPLVVYSKPKEGGFFLTNLRPEYVLVNENGTIFEPPSLSEVKARAVVRYAEVHDRVVPYELRVADVGGGEEDERRRRRQRRIRRG